MDDLHASINASDALDWATLHSTFLSAVVVAEPSRQIERSNVSSASRVRQRYRATPDVHEKLAKCGTKLVTQFAVQEFNLFADELGAYAVSRIH